MNVRHIVVPLDGSGLAETAVPMAARIAQRIGSRLTLLHVLERRPPATVHGERHLATPQEASAYLTGVAASLRASGLDVETHVHENAVRNVAASLSEHLAEFRADLAVMTTHGAGGMRRWVFGSIAQQVIAAGACPVLYATCEQSRTAMTSDIQTIVVPLDGDPAHEASLPLASTLAAAFSAAVRLVTVVPTLAEVGGPRSAVARVLPGALAAALDLEAEGAAKYLKSVRESKLIGAPGANSTADLVERGDPAREIQRLAEMTDRALIVMATHRKFGAKAFWDGSVAARVATGVQCPIAMVCVADGS